MTTSKPMTSEQLDELMTVAVRMQRDAEVDRNFPSANFAYAVQVAVLELRRSREISSALAAENAGLKSNLMFWDAEHPEAPYDSPEEIAEACSLNYNEEFNVHVASKLPNRAYRVCESWEHECKIELVEGDEVKTPATDAFLAKVRATAITDALEKSLDYLDTDCVMDRLDISYEDAQLRSSGAIELHDALVAVANQLRKEAVQ